MKNIMEVVKSTESSEEGYELGIPDVMSNCFLHQDPLRILMQEEMRCEQEHYNDVVFNNGSYNGFQINGAVR